MNQQGGQNRFEDAKNAPEIMDEASMPEIMDEDLDQVTGGGNSAWGTASSNGNSAWGSNPSGGGGS